MDKGSSRREETTRRKEPQKIDHRETEKISNRVDFNTNPTSKPRSIVLWTGVQRFVKHTQLLTINHKKGQECIPECRYFLKSDLFQLQPFATKFHLSSILLTLPSNRYIRNLIAADC
ncbi:MAG: hypothetical protein CW716_13115 [Candidatus Bathyarchaeum sp.]|nr:MAG: hypothetical protein CW716_13115 [Candidatus Bathyarchaeum sp.]